MNKQELVNAIALEFPTLSKKEITNFLKIFTKVLERGFQKNGTVRIDGFGTIKKNPDGSPVFRFFPSFGDESEPESESESEPESEPESESESEPESDEPAPDSLPETVVAPANVTHIRRKAKK